MSGHEHDAVELVDPGKSRTASTSVEATGSSRWAGWLALVAAVPLIVWLLSLDAGRAENEEATEEVGSTSSMPSTRPPATSVTSSVLDAGDESRRSELAAAMQADVERSLTGTTSPANAVTAAYGPILAEPVGLRLVIEADTLRTIDLDTSEVTHHQRVGRILGAAGDVVVVAVAGEPLALVAASDIDGPSVDVDVRSAFGVADSSLDGNIWIASGPHGGSRASGDAYIAYDLVETETGRIMNHLEVAFDPQVPVPPSPELISTRAGAVYALDRPAGSLYRRVVEGRLHAQLGRYALVETCADPLDCSRRWFDLELDEFATPWPVPPSNVSPWTFPPLFDGFLPMVDPGGIVFWAPETGPVPGVILNPDLVSEGGVTSRSGVIAFGRSFITLVDSQSGEQAQVRTDTVDSMVLVEIPEPSG